MKSKNFDIQMMVSHKRESLNVENFKKQLFGSKDRNRAIIPIYKDHNNRIESLL